MQSVSPSEALDNALKQISTLTHTIETQRLEHQRQVHTHTHISLYYPCEESALTSLLVQLINAALKPVTKDSD